MSLLPNEQTIRSPFSLLGPSEDITMFRSAFKRHKTSSKNPSGDTLVSEHGQPCSQFSHPSAILTVAQIAVVELRSHHRRFVAEAAVSDMHSHHHHRSTVQLQCVASMNMEPPPDSVGVWEIYYFGKFPRYLCRRHLSSWLQRGSRAA